MLFMDLTINKSSQKARIDFSQFIPGTAVNKTISPDRLTQPKNIKLFTSYLTKHTQEILGISMQCKVFARTQAKDAVIRRMECEKDDDVDDDCQLERCKICLIDKKVQLLDEILRNLCNIRREEGDLDNAIDVFETCCVDGRSDPLVLISNKRWNACFTKISFELLR